MKFSLPAVTLAAALLPGASATIYYAGVAESSGEFGVWSATSTKGTGLPGRFGVDYSFINNAAVDVMVDQNKVRRSSASQLYTGRLQLLMNTPDQPVPRRLPARAHVPPQLRAGSKVQRDALRLLQAGDRLHHRHQESL